MFAITVPSSTAGKSYLVRKVSETVWTCDCPDHINRSNGEPMVCKHIAQITVSLAAFSATTSHKSKKASEILEQ